MQQLVVSGDFQFTMDVTPSTASVVSADWLYLPLLEILQIGSQVVLVCERAVDHGRQAVLCLPEHEVAFRPYACAFQEWEADRISHERVVVPVLTVNDVCGRFHADMAAIDFPSDCVASDLSCPG